MPATDEQFRDVMSHFATSVTIVTVVTGGVQHGMTATAVSAASLHPPLALVVVDKRWRTHDLIAEAGAFAVNILGEGHLEWSDRFAGRHPEIEDRFFDIPSHAVATGSPILDDALAFLDCTVVASHAAGDHTIFIGLVEAAGVIRWPVRSTHTGAGGPLLYYHRSYHRLGELLRSEMELEELVEE